MPKRIIFTSDLLRIETESQLRNPQSINIQWVYKLFGSIVERLMGLPCEIIDGSAHQRVRWYSELDVPFGREGWATIYEDLRYPDVERQLADLFSGAALVIGFESPPYLIKVLDKAGIRFIDLSIHPVRYLTDYLFGIRSNDPQIMSRIESCRVPEDLFRDFARMSLARSARTYQVRKIVPGSAIFLGQMEFDSTLIVGGKFAGLDEVEAAFLQLLAQHPRVYYKFHPHRRDKESVVRMLRGMKRCEIIDVNIYDSFSAEEFELFASLSSGSLVEASLFGRPIRRFLPKPQVKISSGPLQEYVAASPAIFYCDYWRFIIFGGQTVDEFYPQRSLMAESPMKFTVNLKWGR